MIDIHIIFGWVFILVSTYSIFWALYKCWQGLRSRNWPSESGEITEVRVDHRSSQSEGDGVEYIARIQYVFTVDGVQYQNRSGIHTLIEHWGTKENADRIASGYKAGEQVRVYFNPRDPKKSVLKAGVPLSILWLFPFAMLLIVIGLHFLGVVKLHKLFGG